MLKFNQPRDAIMSNLIPHFAPGRHLYRLALLIPGWLALAPVALAAPQANPQEIIIATPDNLPATDIRRYYEDLLRLALEKTRASDGDFVITHNNNTQGPERERAMLIAEAGITVTWGTVTTERKTLMRLVPVDLVKNLNNYRALIIQANQQKRFDQINTLNDLRQFHAGTGINWASNSIFADNGLKLVTSGSFSGIYKMLASGRVDYVARAPYEVTGELVDYAQFTLKLEDHLLLQFNQPQDYCFFVHKHNVGLAQRLERGLKLAQADGSFDATFARYPGFVQGQQLVQAGHRLTLALAVSPEKAQAGLRQLNLNKGAVSPQPLSH